ncbi:MAG: AarF/ABC1/UbiB kinase family protein [Gammaproteobacteria bacterium]|nr:AarF/ABC1/UbiB kinase family protein [Gammaproteobacteria bacterium]
MTNTDFVAYNEFTFDEPLINVRKVKQLWHGRKRTMRAVSTVVRIERSYAKLNKKTDGWAKDRYKPLYKELHAKNADLLFRLCKNNGATWVKLAQFLSARPDMLPKAYIEALKPLQNENRQIPFPTLVPVLQDELGWNWRDKFEWVDENPIATASIAQVHKARTKEGVDVAIKIQQPHVRDLFDEDFTTFQLIGRALRGKLPGNVDIEQMVMLLLEMTAEELDFRNEEKNTRDFGALDHMPRIRVPVLVENLSTKRVIVTEWIVGSRLVEHLDRSNKEEAKDLLTVLQNSYMQQITQFGKFQADPHPGNFLVTPDKEIFIVDYGTIGRLTPEETMNYSMLIMVLMGHMEGNIGDMLEKAGFQGGIPNETLEELSQYVVRTKRPAKKVNVEEVIGELLETLQDAQVIVPDPFVALGRVIGTLGGFMQTYKVPFTWLPPGATKKSKKEDVSDKAEKTTDEK